MKSLRRKVIEIDEEKCDGCGLCVSACAEGAIAMVDGKARLISDTYCDGLGACLGECPQGAIRILERDAAPFDEEAVKHHLGEKETNAPAKPTPRPAPPAARPSPMGGCPGSALRHLHRPITSPTTAPGPTSDSALSHWPIQLMLVPPTAPFLRGAEILICADCVPFAVPDFHARYLSGRKVLVGCPKLDDLDHYREKLQHILQAAAPASLTVLRMEVPCCGGIAHAALEARDCVAPHLSVEIHTIGIEGAIRREVVPALARALSAP